MTTIRLCNFSGSIWVGWKRIVVDVLPPLASGEINGLRYVVGRRTGLDTYAVDVHCRLNPGEVREVDLARAQPWAFVRGAVPSDPMVYFGTPAIGGAIFAFIGIAADGAGWSVHLRAREPYRPMFVSDLYLLWYPDHPATAIGEATVTASNPAVPDMGAVVPTSFDLHFGDALVCIPGLPVGAPLMPAGTTFADGQCRSFPVVIAWPRHFQGAEEWASAGALANLQVSGNGISRLWPGGNPRLAPGTSPLAWGGWHMPGAIASLHKWQVEPGVGPNMRSADTGAQADQIFVGGECVGTAGLGCETVRYLVALSQSRRPCHHREADGSPLDLSKHPQLVFWDGRPHIPSVSPDQLGKPRKLGESEASGFFGPDVEHLLLNNLCVAARITGSRALQQDLADHARLYLLTYQTDKSRFPYQAVPFAARAVGYEGIAVTLLWFNLEDRALAGVVRARYLERLDSVLLPDLGAAVNDQWDVRVNDPRLGTGEWEIPWQCAVGAYGLDLAGRTFDRPDARALALRGAKHAMARGWEKQPDGTWLTYFNRAVDGRGVVGHDANNFGMPLAPAVVLLHEPNNATARDIWAQLQRDHAGSSWHPPEVAP